MNNNPNGLRERLKNRFRKMEYMISHDKMGDINKFFFTFEKLPRRGKQYWFFIFTSNNPKPKKQLMVTVGNQNVKKYTVDGCEVLKKNGKDPFSYWYYDEGKITRSPTMPSNITMENGMMKMDSGETVFSIKGDYPNHRILLEKEGKTICDIRTSKGKDRRDYDLLDFFKGGVGFGNINILESFEGKLNSKKFSGQCYLQKVVITAPLPNVPWYWGRMVFPDNSILGFLCPHVKLSKLGKSLATSAYFYDSKKGKEYNFNKVKVHKLGKNKRQFFVEAKNKDSQMNFLADSYALKTFKISSIGKLTYEQNLVDVKSFTLEKNGKILTEKDKGNAIGIFEDGYGYVI